MSNASPPGGSNAKPPKRRNDDDLSPPKPNKSRKSNKAGKTTQSNEPSPAPTHVAPTGTGQRAGKARVNKVDELAGPIHPGSGDGAAIPTTNQTQKTQANTITVGDEITDDETEGMIEVPSAGKGKGPSAGLKGVASGDAKTETPVPAPKVKKGKNRQSIPDSPATSAKLDGKKPLISPTSDEKTPLPELKEKSAAISSSAGSRQRKASSSIPPGKRSATAKLASAMNLPEDPESHYDDMKKEILRMEKKRSEHQASKGKTEMAETPQSVKNAPEGPTADAQEILSQLRASQATNIAGTEDIDDDKTFSEASEYVKLRQQSSKIKADQNAKKARSTCAAGKQHIVEIYAAEKQKIDHDAAEKKKELARSEAAAITAMDQELKDKLDEIRKDYDREVQESKNLAAKWS